MSVRLRLGRLAEFSEEADVVNFYNSKKTAIVRGSAGDDTFYAFSTSGGALLSDAIVTDFAWTTSIAQSAGAMFTYTARNVNISTDLLRGSNGYDTIRGSAHDDVLVYNNGMQGEGLGGFRSIDAFYLGDGNDFLDLSAHGPGGVAYDVAAASGEKGNDTLIGGSGFDTLDGGKGNDLLIGNIGPDLLIGGTGGDHIYADHMVPVTTVALGTGDQMWGGDGHDLLVGGAGGDFMFGGNGEDMMYGGLGSDVMRGTYDNDRLFGESGDDLLTGEEGNDMLLGGAGDDALWGEDRKDEIYWYNPGSDLLRGGAGDDMLDGAGGADTLEGGAGSDRMKGGDDQLQDVFVFDPTALSGVDTLEFEDGFDVIKFVDLGITRYEGGAALGTLFARDVPAAQGEYWDHVELDVVTGTGDRFTIKVMGVWPVAVTASDFTAADFVFG
ncbi:calcium-binding protein [Sphingosinicella sp. BN140058]|uniref:calcium-binding protein n=1 Tax=Sphingosinicella sp. BN140058 TaxID=1892855 RepID=UPI001010173C|nr:calcium-binding protein [Sphingosinicella sp. BN140058]QAY78971.1 calcium-binding protein [Sphingosinicella sp. BN140058]